MIGFGDAVALFYKNYVNFEGRSSRAEYWWTFLYQLIVYAALVVAFFALVGLGGLESTDSDLVVVSLLISAGLFWLVNFLPGISLQVRRFHDLDQTGWLVLVFFIVNAILSVSVFAQLIWFAVRGTEGANKYGPDPYWNEADLFG
jgi:uncharacterized membrane protein YhaH (DUF805 family)